jgi:hypothetical protein
MKKKRKKIMNGKDIIELLVDVVQEGRTKENPITLRDDAASEGH